MSRTISKVALVGVNILFTIDDIIVPDRLDPNLTHDFVDITSLDGAGLPVTPASGDYNIFVKTSESGGFQTIADNGTIPANLTGGDSSPDGTVISASFASNPLEIKVVPNVVVGAVSYHATVRQNLT